MIAPTCFRSLQVLSIVSAEVLNILSTIVDILPINAPDFRCEICLFIARLFVPLLTFLVFTLQCYHFVVSLIALSIVN